MYANVLCWLRMAGNAYIISRTVNFKIGDFLFKYEKVGRKKQVIILNHAQKGT